MTDFLTMTVRDILNLYKEKYYEQTGQTLRMGSDDMAASSVHAYVLSVLQNAVNAAFYNSILEGASGAWLDAIGDTWAVPRPEARKADVSMSVQVLTEHTYEAGELAFSDDAGHVFYNKFEQTLYHSGVVNEIICEAAEAGSGYNDINEFKITTIVEGAPNVYVAWNHTISSGGMDAAADTAEGDATYREWIRTQRKTPLVGASKASYLAKVWATEPARLYDATVLEVGDAGYVPGKVKIFLVCKADEATCVENVRNACSDVGFRAIGDLVEVQPATVYEYDPWGAETLAIYPRKFELVATEHFYRVVAEYRSWLKRGFGRAFSEADLIKRLTTPDASGIYALELDVSRNVSTPKRFEPAPGACISLSEISDQLTIQFQ